MKILNLIAFDFFVINNEQDRVFGIAELIRGENFVFHVSVVVLNMRIYFESARHLFKNLQEIHVEVNNY